MQLNGNSAVHVSLVMWISISKKAAVARQNSSVAKVPLAA
jgi:hypothetical protein